MMFKIAGHTMGTPEYTVCEAIELMQKIGADGIEIVVQDDYRSGLPCDCDEKALAEVKQCAERNGIRISNWNYRSPVKIVNVLND